MMNLVRHRSLAVISFLIILMLSAPLPASDTSSADPLERMIRHRFPTIAFDSEATFERAQETVAGRTVFGMRARPDRPAGLEDAHSHAAAQSPDGNGRRRHDGLRVFYPSSYNEAFVVELGEQRVVLRATNAKFAEAAISGGKLVYTAPYTSVEAIQVPSLGRSEELLVLHDERAPRLFEYEIVEMRGVSALTLHDGAIRFTPDRPPKKGDSELTRGSFTAIEPAIQIDRPWLIDGNGRRSETAARWTIVSQGRIRLTIEPGSLSYPVLVDPSFSATGNLTDSRGGLSATLLPNGKVLIAGGIGLNTAETYDPTTGVSTATSGNMVSHRYEHTATLLPNGKVLLVGGQSSGVDYLATAEVYDPAIGTFTPTNGAMASAFAYHTATLLQSGKVLIVGGYRAEQGQPGVRLRTAQLYDPVSGTFTTTNAPMATERAYHTATLLPDGKVLVAGGCIGAVCLSTPAELYDPASGTFTTTSNAMIHVRIFHTATLLSDGKVLITGGTNSRVAEIYDPVSRTFTATSSTIAARERGHTATLLPNGKTLIVGGSNSTGTLNAAELYDPAAGTFEAVGSLLAAPRSGHAATLLPSGVLLTGGSNGSSSVNTMEFYDPADPAFTAASATMTSARRHHTATLLRDGQVLITGGMRSGSGCASECLNTAELYDPATGTFSATDGAMTARRVFHTATLLPDGKVLIAGGANLVVLSSAELYDPVTRTFTATSGSMMSPRSRHTATLLPNGKVLLVGGNTASTAAELYDPITGTFSASRSFPATQRLYNTATLLPNGQVLFAGGTSRNATGETIHVKTAELYDPAGDTFTPTAGPMNSHRAFHTATLLPNGKVLIAGGRPGTAAFHVNTADLYDPQTRTFTATVGAMTAARSEHTATLLQNGMVLITGTWGGTTTADLYDSSTGTFRSTTTAMGSARANHTATLLLNGRVLVSGGFKSDGIQTYLDSADVFDIGLGYQDAWRPAITSVLNAVPQSSQVVASGARFAGRGGHAWESSGGGTRNSSTNYPMLQLRRVDNEETIFLPLDSTAGYSATSFTSGTNWIVNPGPVLVTIFTNGIPSLSMPTSVTCAVTITAHPQSQTTAPGNQATFSVATVAANSYQWQKDATASGTWSDIPGATEPVYLTAAVSAVDSGSRYRVRVNGCSSLISEAATLTVADSQNPAANVVSPSGGEYWLLSIAGNPPNSEVVTWSMSDDVRVCRVDVSLVYSDDGGATYVAAPAGGGLPRSFGAGGSCPYPGEMTTSLTYTVPTAFPSGRSGSLYRIQTVVTDQAGNTVTVRSGNPFYIVQANPDSVKTLILSNVPRMITRQGISTGEAMTINGKLQELANHPRVQGLVVDLSSVTSVNALYAAWDADPSDPSKANAVLFGVGGIHEHLRTNLLPAYTGVKFLVLAGDDRIVPMARLQDRTALLPESTYTDLSPTSTTVGRALAAGKYLTDDPLAVLDAIAAEQLDGNLFLPDLSVGRLVETPQEIITTIATYISQDGVLDLSLLDPSNGHKVLVTGYDFLSNVSRQVRARWKSALGAPNADNSIAPVDGSLIGGNWSLGSVQLRTDALRTKIAGNGGSRYGVMAISGHATHYEEGVPGTDPFDIQGLSTSNLYGTDACATPTAGAVDLSGGVIYAVGCHGGLSVPGSCSTDENHSLDLPQTMLARGAVAYIANSGYGWGLKHGIGYGARLTQIFTEQMTAGGTINVGDAVLETKQRYYLETPRYDAYDEKSVMQWTLYGLPMYAVRTGIAAGSGLRSATQSRDAEEMIGAVRVTRTVPQHVRGGRALRTTTDALPASLTQLNLSFDFTGAGVYTKYDSTGTALPSGPGCPDANGCYYTLNGLVDRGTGSGDLPIQPYMIYDSRLSGSSQHGVLWKGGTYDEESGWKPIIAELVSNGGDGSNHGSTPRTIILRPTAPRVVPGVDSPACRPSDLELNSLTVTAGEAIKGADETYSIARRYRNIDLEVFYFNDRNTPTNNCDRSGPSLGAGPFGGEYHQISGSSVTWSVPASDPSGTWRVVIVYTLNTVDAQSRGTWAPVELTNDGTGIFSANVSLSGATRVTYVVQAADNRGNVTWLDYVTAQLPSSGIVHGIPRAVEMVFTAPLAAPANVVAGAVSTTSVSLTWSSVAAATSYDIYRSASGTSYVKIGSSGVTSYTDNGAATNTAYLYAVRAIGAAANASGYSAPDLATTVVFTDPTLTPGVTTIKAAHLNELRTAVNAVRVLAGSGSYPYVDPTIAPGVTTAKSVHITDLRSALADALTDLSLPPAVYSGSAPDVGLPINAAHITQLRGSTQ